MRLARLIAIPILTACNGSGSVGVDENSSDDGDCLSFLGETCDDPTGGDTDGGTSETVVGENDPGSGPGVGVWRIDAEADGERVDGQYTTQLRVDLEDDQGQAASGRSLVIQTALLGDQALVEDPGNPGRYEAEMTGYARTYTLVVEPDSPVARFETTAVGPGAHDLQVSGTPLDITDDHTVTWAPVGATFARFDSRGGGGQDIPDSGSHLIEAISLEYELGCVGEERIDVRRWEVLDLVNAAPGSTFEVSIKVRANEVDTADSRRSDLDGEVQLDGDYDGTTGDVYVMIWPEKLDWEDEAPWAWTKIEDADFSDQGDYEIRDLAPGDWFGVAYLDADRSDAGQGQPAGPSDDDPFEERDFTIDPGQDRNEDFDLQDQW